MTTVTYKDARFFPEVTVGPVLLRPFDLADHVEVWAARIAAAADLPDRRLNTRLADVLTRLARQPKASLPQAAGQVHQAKSFYRFFQNRRFPYSALVNALAQVTAQSCASLDRVFWVHDSSSLNYSSLKGTQGLGRISTTPGAAGLVLHSVLAVGPDQVVRGLLSVDLWPRPLDQKTKEQRYERPFEEKESFKWVRGLQVARAAANAVKALNAASADPGPRPIHLMDREGDIHEVFADILKHNEGAIIRCAQNRKIDGPVDRAHAAVAAHPCLGHIQVKVGNQDRSPRTAILELRALPVRLTPSLTDYPGRQPLSLNLIEAREVQAPAGTEPIHWRLWTTESIATLAEVVQRVREYSLRWRIEEYHLTLKSGCNTEDLLLETADRLCKAIVLYAAVATRIVALRDLGRHTPDAPGTVLLSPEECAVLTLRFGGDPKTTPTIRQAMKWIGRLGGHLGRKSDGLPGVRTLWRGWRDLAIMVHGYQLRRLQAKR